MEKKVSKEMKGSVMVKKTVPPPPPPPPLPPSWSAKPVKVTSVTRDEIDRFWRRKKIEEEDHLLAAIKAAARIRASRLTGEDYRRFEEALKEDDNEKDKEVEENRNGDVNKEIRIGIKDWWTKSMYAYLNQPALQSMEKPKCTSTYIPINLCFYKPPRLPNHALFGF